ncbi:HAMP domain-containing sensor histidine kinase [Ferrovibrio sp. MS7]|uniref:sensor histidine kinase n=1 Tax=Ferrovibrio plantarum TaxID=3119164 RepID=UPI00313586F6
MFRLTRAVIASVATIAALVAFAAALADAGNDSLQALAQHRLIAAGSLVLAVASALALGIVIGRGASGDAVPSLVEPGTVPIRTDTMSRAETEFLANMSHELRTPLNAMIGFAELILSEIHGPISDRRYYDYVGHIHTGSEQLLAIVDATLDLSQLAAGQLDLRPCRVEPSAIIKECAQSVAAQAEVAKVELVVRPSTASSVAADPVRLKQALTCLLSNAIKFTAHGGRISIGAIGNDGFVAFEVIDNGIGMMPDQVELALQPFRMVDGCMTRRRSGVGLGLTLAQRLVRLHGGELRIESRPGYGTSVTVIMPVISSHQTDKR